MGAASANGETANGIAEELRDGRGSGGGLQEFSRMLSVFARCTKLRVRCWQHRFRTLRLSCATAVFDSWSIFPHNHVFPTLSFIMASEL